MSHKEKIIVLDDDEAIAKTLQFMLERMGYEVYFTDKHTVFFEQIRLLQPQFIFLDLVMPFMDGVEVIEQLALNKVKARIVISSGAHPRVLEAAKLSAIEHGLIIAGILSKPFKNESLRQLLEEPKNNFKSSPSFRSFAEQVQVSDLEQALGRHEISIALQPKVYCANQSLAGFEVLARWQHSELGEISPDIFIAIAEANGLIDILTKQVAEQALAWLAQLATRIAEPPEMSGLSSLLNNLVLSINISARSLRNKELFIDIANQCETYGIRTNRIILELTETSAMDNPLESLDTLTRLRMQGFMVSIDDFGTGYSSMKQLVRLPFSEIKIDKSFVLSADVNTESMKITRSIIELARSLGLSTTAEGIESEEVLNSLRKLGCELAQGFYISRPLAIDKVDQWIISHTKKCEELRLADLAQLELLDTAPEERFDRHTAFAKDYFQVSHALVSLVSRNRQWFKSSTGLPREGTPRSESFCTHAIAGRTIFEVPDTTLHPVFAQYKGVCEEPNVRFYAGVPLRGPSGQHIGTFCIIDTKPRRLDIEQNEKLSAIAKLVEAELRLTVSATTDRLTGVLNRHGLESRSRDLITYAYKLALPVAEITFYFENLLEINRNFGYETGSAALKKIADAMAHIMRRSDIVGRYSGSRFKIFLLDLPRERAVTVLTRLRKSIDESNAKSDTYQIQYRCEVATALEIDDLAHELL